MKRYRNQQANGGARSCLQGGVPFLWLLDKPPAPGIKLPPRRILQPADTRCKDLTEEQRRQTLRQNPSAGISRFYFFFFFFLLSTFLWTTGAERSDRSWTLIQELIDWDLTDQQLTKGEFDVYSEWIKKQKSTCIWPEFKRPETQMQHLTN